MPLCFEILTQELPNHYTSKPIDLQINKPQLLWFIKFYFNLAAFKIYILMKVFSTPRSVQLISFLYSFFSLKFIRCICLIVFSQCLHFVMQAQAHPADIAQAEMLSKKYKDDKVICLSSYQYFTFDKGKN